MLLHRLYECGDIEKKEKRVMNVNIEEVLRRCEGKNVDYEDSVTVLQTIFHKVLRINLTEDTFHEIKVVEYEKNVSKGYSKRLSRWIKDFADNGNVYEKDKDDYLNFCNIDSLRKNLKYSYENSYDNIGIRYRRKIGKKFRWVKMYIMPGIGYSEDNQVGIMFINDIHDDYKKDEDIKKNLKEAYISAEKANAAKTEFLSRMSHDLRTPMNAIMGMTILAVENIDDKEYLKSCMGRIRASSKHLMGIINDILYMSSIESGRVSLCEETFNINTVLNDAISIVSPHIEQKQHTVNVEIGEIRHNRVIGDEKRLQRVFVNVICNAAKYTGYKGIINIRLRERRDNYNSNHKMGQYIFEISDNGIGMSKKFLDKIYEPFERADDAIESGEIGTGLGMSITRSIVQMMNGDIQIQSEYGKGTKITITVWLKYDEEKPDDKESDTDELETIQNEIDYVRNKDFSGKQLLLVEDNEVNLEIARAILNMTGADITVAHNGIEAIEIFSKSAEGHFDMILMDIKMPKMNGCDATKVIRGFNRKDALCVPIIAMTANVFAEDICKVEEAGMNGHIAKPLDLKKLMGLVSTFLTDK